MKILLYIGLRLFLTKKCLSPANQLLNRRVNEWLGNQYSPRYLFNWRELRLIQQQKPYLVWGTNERHKKRLLNRSWKRLYRQLMALAIVLVFFIVGMGWWYSPGGQIQQVRWELGRLGKRVGYEYRQEAAVAFVKDGRYEQAMAIANSINSSVNKAEALRALAETYIKLENNPEAVELLQLALTSAQSIDNSFAKARALSAIVETIGKLENNPKAVKLLKLALGEAQSIDDSSGKARALSALAETYIKLENNPEAVELLQLALGEAQSIDSSSDKARALRALAKTIGKLENNPEAVELLQLALDSAQSLDNSDDKAEALSAIIPIQAKLHLWRQAHHTVSQCPTDECKVESLAHILTAWVEKKNPAVE